MKLHPIVAHALEDLANLPFEKRNDKMEGWYIWRLDKNWPTHEYRIFEVTEGIMVDSEPGDDDYGPLFVCERKLYGEFFGPILLR